MTRFAFAAKCGRGSTPGRLAGVRGSVESARVINRSASVRDAATEVGSVISTSAGDGVLVRGRRTVQTSRSGASNVSRVGGGEVRFQNVYMVRRYRSWPWLCTK